MCFSVNFATFLTKRFFKEHLWWLILYKANIKRELGFKVEFEIRNLYIFKKYQLATILAAQENFFSCQAPSYQPLEGKCGNWSKEGAPNKLIFSNF